MKKALSIILFATMIISLFAFPTSAAWDGTSVSASLKGEGTQASPYLVETAEDLAFLAKSVNEGNSYEGKYIIQTADIDLGGKEWTPIGFQDINDAKTDGKAAAPFSGVYSGLGHKVTGLSITEETTNHLGLFGYVMSGATEAGIANLTVEGAIIIEGVLAKNFGVGGIVGSLGKDTADFPSKVYLLNCTSNVDINITVCYGEPRMGSAAGYIFNGTVQNCVANGDVSVSGTTTSRLGGFVGQTNRTQYLNCIANGNVTSDLDTAKVTARSGGFCGVITRGGMAGDEADAQYTVFENVISTGNATAKSGALILAAGIAADFYVNANTWPNKDCRVKMINCVNTGNMHGETTSVDHYVHVGGLGGYTGNGYTDYEFVQCANGGELTAVGGKEQRVGGLIGTVYAKEAEYKFDQCITVGTIVSACFKFANAEEILAYCTENADPSSILLARYNVESLIKPSELQIAGFNPAKGLAEPEPEVTEPAVTEPEVTEPEVTVPEETKPADPVPTGDASIIFIVLAIISLGGVAAIAKRREN